MTRRPRPCPDPGRTGPAPAALSRTPRPPFAPDTAAGLHPLSLRHRSPGAAALLLLAAAALLLAPRAAHAGIRFENCVQGSDGSISCDTVPTGNTYLNDKDAQYGLLQQASPGWSEFNPYQGFDEDLGGGED